MPDATLTTHRSNILITGLHRSGTTMVCRLLASLDGVIALQEPMKVKGFIGKDKDGVQAFVQEFIDDTRNELLHDHKTKTRYVSGENTDNYFSNESSSNGLRQTNEKNGLVAYDKPLSPDFLLVIKHNAAFAALLDQLHPKFCCYAIIRNPLAILASWQTIDMAVNIGRLPAAEAIDPSLSHTLSSINNTLDRQIFIINWFFYQYFNTLPPEHIIRYEDIIATSGKCLTAITPHASTLHERLISRNNNPLYRNLNLPGIVYKLLNSNGMWQKFYTKNDVEALAATLLDIEWLPASNLYGTYCVPVSSKDRPVSQRILRADIHEPETIAYIRANCHDGDVVHAGTFFGDFLPALSSALAHGAKIWAFEPNYENYWCAINTIRSNNLQNIELLNAGLGEGASEANLFIRTREGENLGGASTITQNNDQDLTVSVRLVSIDQFIPLSRNISIIQLDVEGYEKQALSGALQTILRNKPLIIMEDNNGITNTAWFEQHILSLGYTPLGKVHNNHIFRW